MTTAEQYVQRELTTGRLTARHIVELVRVFQAQTPGLDIDGKPGPLTRAKLESQMPMPRFLGNPLPTLPDGRVAVITSQYQTKSRPDHDGVDWFYHWQEGDQPDVTANGKAAGHQADGKPKWVVPYGVTARAAAGGVVSLAGNSATGYRCWIDHGNGYRSGYFHMLDLKVSEGAAVAAGAELGHVGWNPSGGGARHLHFEVSPVDRYHPLDPELFLLRD